MFGGWVVGASESVDGIVHVGIPETPGSWQHSCEMRGYSWEKGTLGECPINKWLIESTMEFYHREGDSYGAITAVQGMIKRSGLGYEGSHYESYWAGMADFTLDAAMVGLDASIRAYGWKWFSSWNQDPSKTVRLAETAYSAAKAEEAALAGARADRIREYVLEQGLNLVEENGQMKSLPVTVGREAAKVGRQARVYPSHPDGRGGWYNQTKITGQPDPRFFQVDGIKYVLVFEHAAEESGRVLDGIGRLVSSWPHQVTLVEVKSGYDKYIDPRTGEFFDEFNKKYLPRILENFRQDNLKADALGIENRLVFTRPDVKQKFMEAAERLFGKDYMDTYGYRVIVSTQKVVDPLLSDEPIKPVDPPVCGPRDPNCPIPDSVQGVKK